MIETSVPDLFAQALLAAAALCVLAIAYLALLRHLWLVVLAVVALGFAFAPAEQLRFTAVLLGLLAALYGLPLALGLLRPGRLAGGGWRDGQDAERDLTDAIWQANPSAGREDRAR